ncbi:hypothetical protein HYX02_07935 [Candidatus Woesearchaeota archaeon]|nr:hypothetical protein [Candidatus Woesearchaeota archaeon]
MLGKKAAIASQMFPPNKILFWLGYGVAVAILLIGFILVIQRFGSEQIKIRENLESFYLIQRFFKSPNCLIYSKEDIMLTGIIDLEKFNSEKLSSCYRISGDFPAFKMTLKSDGLTSPKTVKTPNWNENRESELKLPKKNVPFYSDNKLSNGVIEIEVQNPK